MMRQKREYRIFYLSHDEAAAVGDGGILPGNRESEGALVPVPRELSRLWNLLADGTGGIYERFQGVIAGEPNWRSSRAVWL